MRKTLARSGACGIPPFEATQLIKRAAIRQGFEYSAIPIVDLFETMEVARLRNAGVRCL
jgi:hypothetical protein